MLESGFKENVQNKWDFRLSQGAYEVYRLLGCWPYILVKTDRHFKGEAVSTSETSVNFYNTTLRKIPEEVIFICKVMSCVL
jgi:hypothetical protein